MKRDWNFGNWHEWKRFFSKEDNEKWRELFLWNCRFREHHADLFQTKPSWLRMIEIKCHRLPKIHTHIAFDYPFSAFIPRELLKIQLSRKTWKMPGVSNAARVCNRGGGEELNANSTNKSTHFTALGHLTFHNSEHGSHCQPQSVALEKASPNAQSIGDIPSTPHRWRRGKDVIFTSAFSHRNTFLATWRSNAEGLLLIGNFSLYLALSPSLSLRKSHIKPTDI